jgi:outer membrane protein OmpA-like peptidoglycan-associated protein
LRRAAPIILAAVVAWGCAPIHPALFVVVPGSDGHVGKIVVRNGGEPHVIDTAYGGQRLGPDGTLEATRLTPEEVRAIFGPTLAALPGKPATFTLYFREGRDELTPESRAELERVFSELKRRPLPDILVIGHTDTVGGLAYNDRLSLARAQRLREMLVEMGIPAERIEAAGRGKRELLVPTEDNVSEARNRRVEINVR